MYLTNREVIVNTVVNRKCLNTVTSRGTAGSELSENFTRTSN